MKRNTKLQRWILAGVAGLAMAGSISTSLGAVALTNDFTADINGWGVGFGTGSVEWNATGGPDGSGCLMFVLDASLPANKEVAPQINFASAVGTTINSAEYASIEYDLRIDAASGFDAGGSSYGNLQEAMRDSTWSWDAHWVGALGGGYNSYTHMSFAIPNVAKTFPWLTFALQGTAPYSGSVTGYIDNVVIKPFINPLVVATFTNESDVVNWGSGQRATLSFGSLEAGGGSPPGSLQVDVAYDDSTPGGWQEGLATYPLSFSPNRYTYAAFDLYVENPNALVGPGLGQASLFLNTGGWTTVGTVSVNTSMVGTWTHVELPMPASASASQLIFQFGGNGLAFTNGLRYYLDNIQFYKPNVPPTLAISKAGPPGVQITLAQPASQWQREAIATPALAGNSMWYGSGSAPVTYSFTIADFPNPVAHEGFEAHLYIVNGDTASSGDQTYGGCDWNVPDIAIMSIVAVTNNGGTYQCQFQWKTNSPNSNPLDDAAHRPGMFTNSTILGTWSLSFKDNTNVTMTGPGGFSTNFFMSEEAVTGFFSPSTSFLQFGFHKNDNENNGHNDGTSGTFSQVGRTTAMPDTFTFYDTFNGPTLTNAYEWRKTLASAVNLVPPGTAWFINWTLPADGFTMQSAPEITGPWGDAGVTNTYQVGTKIYGQIPAAALPPGNAAYFRMYKP